MRVTYHHAVHLVNQGAEHGEFASVQLGTRALDARQFVMRIEPGKKNLPALPLADTASPGEEVSVISHPQGRHYCLTNGRISRYHRETNEETGETNDWLSITADFALGSSGGPVLNNKGEVVGMVASTLTAYAENSDCKAQPERDVQMVFKDCIPLRSIRGMFQSRE